MECCSVMVVVGGLVAKLCPTLSTIDCSLPGSSVYGIFPGRILECVAMPSSRGSSQPGDRDCVSCICCAAAGFLTAELAGSPCLHCASQSIG